MARRIVLSALATSLSAASTTTIDWNAQFSADPKTTTVDADADLVFSWSGGHDVWIMADEFSYEECDFSGGTNLGSSVGSHCAAGQKVAVTWESASGAAPAPTAGPAPSPTAAAVSCADDESWYKKNAPAKDCAWVANLPEDRCGAKGDDSQAWQSCPVVGFYYNRASVIGEDGSLAYEACPSATRRCYYDGYDDSETWAKRDQPWKDCAWAAEAMSRCIAIGEDGSYGFESCQAACLIGKYADSESGDDDAWAKKNSPSKDCAWVANDAPARCSVKGEDDSWAFQSCPDARTIVNL
ncbi:FK506 binding protein [Aureococcus anophagefferens]|nr:FK506 binding protein [Aureococcus anophagefferens]